jgi:hypothetical protein
MRYFGIKTPGPDSYIWWLAEDASRAWMAFFTYPDRSAGHTFHRLPLAEAIRAYEAIGYKCVEIKVTEIN